MRLHPSRTVRNVARALRNEIARGLALALGLFALAAVGGAILGRAPDFTAWWLDIRALPRPVAFGFALIAGVLCVDYALRRSGPRRDLAVAVAMTTASACALQDTVTVLRLASSGAIRCGSPVPLSLVIAGACVLVAAAALAESIATRPPRRTTAGRVAARTVWAGTWAVAFALLQMVCFGTTDYRRPADAVVVFGAGVSADGRMSPALADRVRTAVSLYRDGLARCIVFSGGPGRGAIHETEAMRRRAVADGVPEEDIIIDAGGVNTFATTRNCAHLVRERGFERILAVSHFYHLPRVKMAFLDAGTDVFTVPAEETRPLRRLPWYMAREVAAFWVYFARHLASPVASPV